MTDNPLQSLHLEGTPRREEYRVARARLQEACGEATLMGAPPDLPAEHPGLQADAPTLAGPIATRCAFWLEVAGTQHLLAVGVNTIGRLPDNAIPIRDEHVSRRHCAIVIHQDGRCELYDVASKNGTVLNGRRIPGPSALKSGDVITLCTRRVTFIAKAIDDPLAGLI